MSVKTGSITNGDVLLNGTDIAGRLMEFEFGDFDYEEVEHKALGMIGVLKNPSRVVTAIEETLKFEWLDPELKRQLMNPRDIHKLQIHQYVDVNGPDGLDVDASHTLVTHIGFRFMGVKKGTAKLGESEGLEVKASVQSFVEKVYGDETPIMEFDVNNNINKVNGEDVWPT